MHGSIRPFQFGLPRDIKLPEAKTTNRTAFIEPIQCKPVTALPAGEKWTFEIKLDGYRCIAVKRYVRSGGQRPTTLATGEDGVANITLMSSARGW